MIREGDFLSAERKHCKSIQDDIFYSLQVDFNNGNIHIHVRSKPELLKYCHNLVKLI